jgi:hypothetical protein
MLVGQPDPASLAPGAEARVGGVPDVLARAWAVFLEGAFGEDQVVGLSPFVHVPVVHPLQSGRSALAESRGLSASGSDYRRPGALLSGGFEHHGLVMALRLSHPPSGQLEPRLAKDLHNAHVEKGLSVGRAEDQGCIGPSARAGNGNRWLVGAHQARIGRH